MTRVAGAIARVATGNTLAQGLVALSSLLIARLAAPSQFGAYAAITATTSVLGVLASLRLELAIPIPQKPRQANDLLATVIASSLATASLLGMITFALYFTGILSGLPGLSSLLLVLSLLSIALIGIFNGLNQMVLRNRLYHALAVRVVTQAFVTSAIQVALVAVAPTATSLLAGQVVGQTLGVILLFRALDSGDPLPRPSLRLATRYREFPLIAAPAAVLNTLGLHLPLMIGTVIWGASFGGWFGMTQRLLALPIAVFGGAIGQVFIGEFSSRLRSNDPLLVYDFRRASTVLCAIGGMLGVGVFLLAPAAFAWVLGSDYGPTGLFAKALALGFATQLVASPLSVLLPLLGKQLWQGGWDVARLISTSGVLSVAGTLGLTAEHALWMLGVVNATLYTALWLMIKRAVKLRVSSMPCTGQGIESLNRKHADEG